MYLLCCESQGEPDHIKISLKEFSDAKIPRYAILSHRWGAVDDEVTFGDLMSGKAEYERQIGYAKIEGCCRQALEDGISYVWIDSCCIDKRSSAELSEAINSMYRYYQEAEVCYAYLEDVPSASEDPRSPDSHFRRSVWFKRGWTLQELLAPEDVIFFDGNWVEIGTKIGLAGAVKSITNIDEMFLLKPKLIRETTIARRMSWAATRQSTRVEDMAYSLMGIFNVNMPVIYGEGREAFTRLQLEIIRTSNDHTIFAWELPHVGGDGGMLASSPAYFKRGSRLERIPYHVWLGVRNASDLVSMSATPLEYSFTNVGLRIWLQIAPIGDDGLFKAKLACKYRDSDDAVSVYLRSGRALGMQVGTVYNRVSLPPVLNEEGVTFDFRQIYIAQWAMGLGQDNRRSTVAAPYRRFLFDRRQELGLTDGFMVVERYPSNRVYRRRFNRDDAGLSLRSAVKLSDYKSTEMVAVFFGTFKGQEWVDLSIPDRKDETAGELFRAYQCNHGRDLMHRERLDRCECLLPLSRRLVFATLRMMHGGTEVRLKIKQLT